MAGKLGALALGVILLLCGDPGGADPFMPLVDPSSCLMGTGAIFSCCESAGAMLEFPSLFTATVLGLNQSYVKIFICDRQARSSLFQLKLPYLCQKMCRVVDAKKPFIKLTCLDSYSPFTSFDTSGRSVAKKTTVYVGTLRQSIAFFAVCLERD